MKKTAAKTKPPVAKETLERLPSQGAVTVIDHQSTLPASAPQSNNLMEAIARAAADPATDMDKMERLYKMHHDMVKSQAEQAFNDAMARVQAAIEPVVRNQTNSHTDSQYADLFAISEAIKPIYSGEGFSLVFDTETSSKPNHERVVCFIKHRQGHTQKIGLDIALDAVGAKGTANKTATQAVVSTNTYGRRCLTCMAFNVSMRDRDGNDDKKKDEIPVDEVFLAMMEKEAKKGMTALRVAWDAGTAKQRDSCKGKLTWLKAEAHRADVDAGRME